MLVSLLNIMHSRGAAYLGGRNALLQSVEHGSNPNLANQSVLYIAFAVYPPAWRKLTSDVSTSCTSFSSPAFATAWDFIAGGVGSGGPVGLASPPAPFDGAPPFSGRLVPGPRDMVLSARSRVIGGRKSVDALVSAMLGETGSRYGTQQIVDFGGSAGWAACMYEDQWKKPKTRLPMNQAPSKFGSQLSQNRKSKSSIVQGRALFAGNNDMQMLSGFGALG